MRIKSVDLVNLQSWKGEGHIELSPFSIAALRAASETGKSTLFRTIMRFCLTTSYKDTFSDMIRDGETSGGLVFTYEDDSKTVMLMSKDGRMLAKQNPAGEFTEVFRDSDINEQVLEHFGFVADLKNGIMVNLYSRDLPMLFVSTTPMFNGAVLSRVLIDRRVEAVLDYLKLQQSDLTDFVKNYKTRREDAIQACKSIKYIDTDNLKLVQGKIEQLTPCVTYLQKVSESLKTAKDAVEDLQKVPTVPLDRKGLELLSKTQTLLNNLKPKTQDYKSIMAQSNTVGLVPFSSAKIQHLQSLSNFILTAKSLTRDF